MMPSSGLPTREPRVNLETAPFWDGCARGVLTLPRCERCQGLIWYPRRFCPECGSRDVDWVEVAGTGTIYSFTVIRTGSGAYRAVAPYVVAYIELDEGPRLMSNVVDVDPSEVAIGRRVRVVFDPAGDHAAIPRFTPVP
jgi:uncharacterized OB-fold protein